jgi:hypothetical protein
MTERETETLILHERGEHAAGALLGPDWQIMLASCSQRRAELRARAVRDNLADCLSTLPTLLDRDDPASLHFWFANFDGMRREIYPWLADAYDRWLVDGERSALAVAVATGRRHWQCAAEQILVGYRAGSTETEIPVLASPV